MKKDLKVYFIIISVIIIMILLNSYKLEVVNKLEANIVFLLIETFLIILSLLIIHSIYSDKKISDIKIFYYTIPVFFILMLMFMPIFTSHDESWHWYRVYDIAQGNLFTNKQNSIPISEMPKSIDDISLEKFKYGITYSDLKDMYNTKLDKDNTKIYQLPTTAIFAPLQYLPQATGTFIAKLLTDRPVIMAYAGKILNAIMSIILLILAIKIIPFGKKILLTCICIPIAIEGLTSLSGDAMTISCAVLLTSYILKLAYQKENIITTKQKVVLTVLCVVMSLCKIVYLPLVGLVLIIPKEKFKTKKESNITKLLIIATSIVVGLTWLYIAGQSLYTRGPGELNTNLVLTNPIQYIKMFIYTIDTQTSSYILSLFGQKIGDCELIDLGLIITYVNLALFVVATILSEDTRNKFSKYQKIIIILVALATIALIFTSLFIQWTTEGADFIEGVQGRYFIPILLIVAILVSSVIKIKSNYKEENLLKFIGITQILSILYIITSIIIENL